MVWPSEDSEVQLRGRPDSRPTGERRSCTPARRRPSSSNALASGGLSYIIGAMQRLLLLAAYFAVSGTLRAQCPDGSPPSAGICSRPPVSGVAVLYFENVSRDTNYAYLAAGLTESLIDRWHMQAFPSLRASRCAASGPRAIQLR